MGAAKKAINSVFGGLAAGLSTKPKSAPAPAQPAQQTAQSKQSNENRSAQALIAANAGSAEVSQLTEVDNDKNKTKRVALGL